MPEGLLSKDVGLLQLLEQSYAGWTRNRPYALPSEEPAEPVLPRVGEGADTGAQGGPSASSRARFGLLLDSPGKDQQDPGGAGILSVN